MNFIDVHISLFFSSFARQHPALTSLFSNLADSYFFRGQIMMLAVWWTWFLPGPERLTRRRVLLATLLACVLGLAIGRAMVSTLPLRLRPNDNPVFHFTVAPFSAKHEPESSFPSDHAILFVSLAVGIFLVSRRLGSAALAYVVALICFPRLWLGFHYLSDLVAGALIGGGLVLLLNRPRLRLAVTQPLLNLLDAKPQLFYVGLFFFSYQVAEMFDPLRNLLGFVHQHAGAFLIVIMGG